MDVLMAQTRFFDALYVNAILAAAATSRMLS